MIKIKEQLNQLPKSAGVYLFKDSLGNILYIGKAKNLRSRVRSYFQAKLLDREKLPKMVGRIDDIEIKKTESEIEAILLEARLIKKYKPIYNQRQKDDKSFLYVFIDFSSDWPKIKFVREKELFPDRHSGLPPRLDAELGTGDPESIRSGSRISPGSSGMTHASTRLRRASKLFGPFTRGRDIREILNFMRRIIPYADCSTAKYNKHKKMGRGCQWYMIEQCDGPCINKINKKEYRKNISLLGRFLSGGLKKVRASLKKDMKIAAKEKNFEKAAEMRDRLRTLDHIQDIALQTTHYKLQTLRIEGLDISNIQGKEASGSIVLAEVKIPNIIVRAKSRTNKVRYFSTRIARSKNTGDVKFLKNGYRRFKINVKNTPDDVNMIREVIKRRFAHKEWKFPNILLIDGGKGQLNAVNYELQITCPQCLKQSDGRRANYQIPVIAIAKGPSRKGEKLLFSKNFDKSLKKYFSKNKNMVKLVRDEAHRFAVSYHRILRRKKILES